MSLSDLTAAAVMKATSEFDEIGRTAFLEKYGFSPARKYFLTHQGVAYDSKAICGAAHGFLGPGFRPLLPSEFSGGEQSVVARLAALGFDVRDSKHRLSIRDDEGAVLSAECELHRRGAGFVITTMSRGGAKGTPTERNADYTKGLRCLVRRMARLGVQLDAALLDTETTRNLPERQRRLLPSAPLRLTPQSDVDNLIAQLTGAAARFSKPNRKGPGNKTKQIQLLFSGGGLNSVDDVRVQVIGASLQMFVLTWNPQVWPIDENDLADHSDGTWSTGNRKTGISDGDFVVLFRQGDDRRGLIALGEARGPVFQGQHFNDESKIANYVPVSWVDQVPVDERIDVHDLVEIAPGAPWNAMYSSGFHLSKEDAAAVLQAWRGAVTVAGEQSLTGDEGVGTLPEGAKKTVLVNRYERNRQARRKCLAHHGTACVVCGIDFGSAYDGIADGFIHVHHVTPISAIGVEYELDPVTDLVPVCPNCHAMLHHGVSEPRSVDELKALLTR